MKISKISALLTFILITCFATTACGNETNTTSENQATQDASQTTTQATSEAPVETTPITWEEELKNINDQAQDMLKSAEDKSKGITVAVEFYAMKIGTNEDLSQKNDILIDRGHFLSTQGNDEDAIADLTKIDEAELNDSQKLKLFETLKTAYQKMDDIENANIYETKLTELANK